MSNIANAAAARMVATQEFPTSFFGKGWLFAFNLGLMTAFTCLGVMLSGWLFLAMWKHRRIDRLMHPVTIYRLGWFFASGAVTLRCGAEAANLWGWDANAADLAVRVMLLKRIIDPISLTFGMGWMVCLILSYPAMVAQLRKAPFPLQMLARLHTLKRPALVVALSFGAAVGVVLTK